MNNKGFIKNWPLWVLVCGGIVVIFIALNQQETEDKYVSINDIPTEKEIVIEAEKVTGQTPNIDKIKVVDKALKENMAGGTGGILQKSFSVQIFAFRDKAKAEQAVDELQKKDYPAFIIKEDLGGKGVWNKVRVGQFSSREEAIALLKEIKKDYQNSFIITN